MIYVHGFSRLTEGSPKQLVVLMKPVKAPLGVTPFMGNTFFAIFDLTAVPAQSAFISELSLFEG